MSKTNFSDGSYLTPVLANTWYNTDGGHKHDDVDADGHSTKIVLDAAAHVSGQLPSDNIAALDPAKLTGPVRSDTGVTGMINFDRRDLNSIHGLNVAVSDNGVTAYNEVLVQHGCCADSTNVYMMDVPGTLGSFVQKMFINLARTDSIKYTAGGVLPDTLTLTAGWYHVFVIGIAPSEGTWAYNCTTGIDNSLTAVNLRTSSGCNIYRRVGSVQVTGVSTAFTSPHFQMRNGQVILDTQKDSTATVASPISTTSSFQTVTLPTPGGVNCMADLMINAAYGAGSWGYIIRNEFLAGGGIQFDNQNNLTSYSSQLTARMPIYTSTTSTIQIKSAGLSYNPRVSISVVGWYDYRGTL